MIRRHGLVCTGNEVVGSHPQDYWPPTRRRITWGCIYEIRLIGRQTAVVFRVSVYGAGPGVDRHLTCGAERERTRECCTSRYLGRTVPLLRFRQHGFLGGAVPPVMLDGRIHPVVLESAAVKVCGVPDADLRELEVVDRGEGVFLVVLYADADMCRQDGCWVGRELGVTIDDPVSTREHVHLECDFTCGRLHGDLVPVPRIGIVPAPRSRTGDHRP